MTGWSMGLSITAIVGVLIGVAAILLEKPKKKLVLALRILSAVLTLGGIVGGLYLAAKMREPRHLNPKQVRELAASLESYSNKLELVVVRWTLQTREAREFAQQIYGALDSAGWNVQAMQSSTEALSGMSVRFDTRFPNSDKAAMALVKQLRRFSLKVEGPVLDTNPGEQRAPVTVYVGEK